MELTFIGADHEVTGSCHCLKVGEHYLLVDYGMEQGVNIFENEELPVPASAIELVLLTHAHIDHSGMLPALYRDGFRGRVACTRATADLCGIMLRDSAHIQEQEAARIEEKQRRKGIWQPVEPDFTLEDTEALLTLIDTYDYEARIDWSEEISFRFTDIGHLLGSASIEVWLREDGEERKLVFSGDIGNTDQALIRDPAETKSADYVIMESTYGDRLHEEPVVDYEADLAKVLGETFSVGGNVIIPSFAVGRTQEILYYIRRIKERGLLTEFSDFPVVVDSPLAIEATEVFVRNQEECYDEEARSYLDRGINPLDFPGLRLTTTSRESQELNTDMTPKVIIAASGMCDAGRIRHHLKHNLWRSECTILFVGYQSVGTPGRKLVDGAKSLNLFGEEVAVRAGIKVLPGISGHADKEGLLAWLKGFTEGPQRVFVVHGEDTVTQKFCGSIRDTLGLEADAPYSGASYDLIKDRWIRFTQGRRAGTKRTPGGLAAMNSYARLTAAGKELADLIADSEGLPNKEKDRLTQEIKALCEKYRIGEI